MSISFYSTDEQFVCELEDGSDVPIEGSLDQMEELRFLLNNGTLVSGESSVEVEEDEDNQDEGMHMMRARAHSDSAYEATAPPPKRFKLPPGQIKLQQTNSTRRRLASYHGTKPVLVVKVIDADNLSHPDSPSVMSDKVFGTSGDSSTMTSQFAACSFNKLQIVPGGHDSSQIQKVLSAPGVLEVKIPISIKTSGQGDIRKEVKAAAEAKLGFSLPGPFQHVMIVLESCYTECGW